VKIIWDEPKRLSNLAKHGLDLAEIAEGFDFDRAITLPAQPSLTGATRIRMIGKLKGERLVAVIASALGSEAISIVSLRRASKKERKLYDR
jgi:uncharacterized protein